MELILFIRAKLISNRALNFSIKLSPFLEHLMRVPESFIIQYLKVRLIKTGKRFPRVGSLELRGPQPSRLILPFSFVRGPVKASQAVPKNGLVSYVKTVVFPGLKGLIFGQCHVIKLSWLVKNVLKGSKEIGIFWGEIRDWKFRLGDFKDLDGILDDGDVLDVDGYLLGG